MGLNILTKQTGILYYSKAGVAQLVEQLICNHQVRGSSPCSSTTIGEQLCIE